MFLEFEFAEREVGLADLNVEVAEVGVEAGMRGKFGGGALGEILFQFLDLLGGGDFAGSDVGLVGLGLVVAPVVEGAIGLREAKIEREGKKICGKKIFLTPILNDLARL